MHRWPVVHREVEGEEVVSTKAEHPTWTPPKVPACVDKLEVALRRISELEAQVEILRCGDLIAFADGELEDARAEAFSAHLARCAACTDGLADVRRVDGVFARARAAESKR